MQSTINRNKFCRLCLSKTSDLKSIFDENDISIQNDVCKYIYLFFAVEVTKTDPYSTYLCKSCRDIIVTMCKYRLKFRKNDALLQSGQKLIKVKFKVTPRCHESVKKLFVKYKKIKIPQELWGINLNPQIVLMKSFHCNQI